MLLQNFFRCVHPLYFDSSCQLQKKILAFLHGFAPLRYNCNSIKIDYQWVATISLSN